MSIGSTNYSLCILVVLATCFFEPENTLAGQLDKLSAEEAAYYRVSGGSHSMAGRDWKGDYMKKLSPGGRAYFLACRRDYKEALLTLEKLPRRDTGSYFYVKAFCLEGLGRHAEAVKNYEAAKSKIGPDFHPGFRFYLQCATANMKVGNEKKSLADLDMAGPSSEEYGKFASYPRFVRDEVSKRKCAVSEYRGRYKEAFEKYLALFNMVNDQFRFHESLTGDAESKARATDWLGKHAEPTSFKSETEQSIYYLTKGKANMVLGNIAEAKRCLARASQGQSRDCAPLAAERLKYEDPSVLMRIKDQAKTLLVKIYYKEKDYRKCCQYMRCLFSTEVMESFETIYNTIAMHDVRQLVTQKDVDLHNPALEFKLDQADLVIRDGR